MASMLDKSLDDLIKEQRSTKKPAAKSAGGRGAGRGAVRGGRGGVAGGRGRGVAGNSRVRAPVAVPISRPRAFAKPARARAAPERARQTRNLRMIVENDDMWEHDMYEVQTRAPPRALNIETGTKLLITNLHFNVSQEDIKELFEELGAVKKAQVHYDRSGRSKGTADVVFAKKADAVAAVRRYNGVRLDGQAMQIEIKAGVTAAPGGGRQLASGISVGGRGGGRDRERTVFVANARAVARPARGGGRGSGRGGRGGRGPPRSFRTAEELDADLESYQDMEA